MSTSTENFYAELTAYDSFLEVIASAHFVPVPQDWYLMITDVIGSTQAIAAGRYKEVNMIGACSIVTILNVAGAIEVPFVFGGDGATILVPPCLLPQAARALLATKEVAQREFALNLRIGAMPVQVITTAGYEIKVAKFRASENYTQVIIAGGGLAYAEQILKGRTSHPTYEIDPVSSGTRADFTGLECRWQDVKSKHGEMLSLLVLATLETPEQNNAIYQRVITQIGKIYGEDVHWCPVGTETLHLAFDQNLLVETKVRSRQKNWLGRQLYLYKIWLENLLGFLLMRFNVKVGDLDWGCYKNLVTVTTDYKKFDDMLRLIISGNTQQRQQLVSYLEQQYQQQKLVYGLHVSDRALMTCLVFERNGRQVHFLDGGDGGYALAAQALKARLRTA